MTVVTKPQSPRWKPLVLCAAFLGGATCPARSNAADKAAPLPRPSCVAVTTQVRPVVGYDHLVHLQNNCKSIARCEVSTNVNPRPQAVVVAPGRRETVLTFRGSPARTFEAAVGCKLDGEPS